MAATKGKDTSCLEILIANGLLMSSEEMIMSSNNVLVNTSTNRNIQTVANGRFSLTDDEQPLHVHDRLSNNSRLSNDLPLLSSKSQELLGHQDQSDFSSRSEFPEAGHRDHDEFAQKFHEEIAAFDGNPEQELSSTFSADNTGFLEETADDSPHSQTNSDGTCNILAKTRCGQRSKGRPAKAASNGVASNRTVIQCSTCRKTFNNSSALAKHKLIHSTERKYTCTLCSKAFKRQDHLNGHMMTHCSKKPYECKFIGCDKSYCDARSLRRHHENHHQQLMDSSMTTGSDASLTPGLTPGGNSDSQSGIFRFDLPSMCLNQDQGLTIRGEIGGSPSHELSPLSPNFSISPSAISQKTGAWTMGFNPLDEPKPVQCTVCDRRFRNMPALNGHMRLHGGYMKKDTVEAEKPEDSLVSSDTNAVTSEVDQCSLSFSISCGQLSRASSCSALPTSESVFSSIDIVVPKHEDSFADIFASSNIPDTLINMPMNGANGLLQSLAQPNQLEELNFKELDLQQDEQRVDQRQDIVGHLRIVGDACRQNSLASIGHGWTEQQHLNVASSSSSLLDNSTLRQKFVPNDQNMAFGKSVISLQRLLEAASQLSITVQSPLPQQKTMSDTAAYNSMNSNLINYTNPDNPRFVSASANGPACNTPTTPTVISGNKGHSLLLQNQPLTPTYIGTQGHPPSAPLHRSASTTYTGNQTPCTPHSPFIKCSQISGPSQMSGNAVFFQFPSIISGTENPIASHSSTPNLPSYSMHVPHTPQTPHTPYTPNTPKYTPGTSRHFQFPPSTNFPEGSTSCGSPYPHHHSKSYHPYSRPVPASPRYINQTSVQQQELVEDFRDVEQKIDEHIQLLHQEDLMKQQLTLQNRDCVTAETNCKGFSILGSVFDNGNLGSQPDAVASSIEMHQYLEGIGQEPGSFDVEMELTSACPVLDSLNAINPSELSALLDDRPSLIPVGDIGQEMPEGVEEVIQLLREQLGNAISSQDLGLVGETNMQQESISMETYHSQVSDDFNKSGVLTFATCPAVAMNCDSTISLQQCALADCVGLDSSKTEQSVGMDCITETGKKGRKHRPEPLHIPLNVNSYGYPSQLRSPRLRDTVWKKVMPYTPPPMISPARKGSGVFWNLFKHATPQSAPPCNPCNHNSTAYTFDHSAAEDSGKTPETDILPHVNIGPEFQAAIPHIVSDEVELQEKTVDVNEELVWDPKTMESLTEEELCRYQEFICCAPILGNGTNKEEALHLLQKCNGSTKMAILKLMTGEFSRHESNGNSDFRCKENDSWKSDEIEKYHNALLVSDKDFTEIAKEVGTKSVKQCVKFYYVWKKLFGDDYRTLSQNKNQLLMETCSIMAESLQNQVVLDISPAHRSSDHGL